MPAPRVFVSSTFYDLRYIRENLKFFISSLGYQPILSEEGAIYYDPQSHVHDAALAEVPNCQMLVLIIGGRYGQMYQTKNAQSITNAEYKAAVEAKLPVFALVQREVREQYRVYKENRGNKAVDENSIIYPGVDTPRIFDFIEEVEGQSANNALVSFDNFEDIQTYLRQQWASMMFNSLTSASEAHRVADMLGAITEMGKKIEYLTSEVLRSVGKSTSQAAAEMYDMILSSDLSMMVRSTASCHMCPRHETSFGTPQ